MKGKWTAGLILLVAACAPPTQPSAKASVSNTPINSVVSPSPEPTNTLPLAKVDFHCSLPVYKFDGNRLTNAFIAFPTLAITPAGEGGYYYDRVVTRWLPVFRQRVSPDGRRYAYSAGWTANPPVAPRVHIVDAATGADLRVVTMPDAAPYSVIDFTDRLVYLAIRYEGNWPGYWSVDPDTGAVAKVSDGYYQPSGAGWFGTVDSRDPTPYITAIDGQAQPNRIDWRDAAGKTTPWFYQPGHALYWVAFAGSATLLVLSEPQDTSAGLYGTEYWLVRGPEQATKLAGKAPYDRTSWPYLDLHDGFFTAVADSHGIWIGSQRSIYVVKPNGEILRVFGEPAYPANGCA
jgi:hypothetical protein